METANTTNPYAFLQAGEMSELIRTYDWSLTSVGTPDQWPQSLRTTLNILLHSKFPMFLWWGSDLVQFYNDAYRPSLGHSGKHPKALGQRGEECWPETWPTMKPLIDQVLQHGEGVWNEDRLIPIYRNDQLEDVYWTFSCSPVYDEWGKPAGVLAISIETTENVLNRSQLAASKDELHLAVQKAQYMAELATENAGIGIFQVDVATGQTDYNSAFAYVMTGDTAKKHLNREQLIRYIHPDDELLRAATLQTIYEKGEFAYEPRVIWDDGSVHRIQVRGKMVFNEKKQPVAYSGTARDVTEQRKQDQALTESEAKFRSLIQEAPVGTCLFVGRELIIEVANEPMIRYWGKDRSAIGKPLAEAIPELKGQPFLGILDSIFTTGETFEAKSAPAQLEINGVLNTYYFDYTFKPLFANGEVYAIMDMAVDVTEQVLARRELEESELFSRSVIENSPVAKAVFAGSDLRIKTVNQNMLAMLGRDASVIGMPFLDIIPELRDTLLPERLRHVLATGETYQQPEEKIEFTKNDEPYTGYYNFIYKALQNTAGEIYGLIVTATEVTEQVLARQKVEEAEAALRGAIELAKLGTWQIDLVTRILDYSPRLRQWCGMSQHETITVERAYYAILPADHERVRSAIFKAITPGSDGVYDVEYSLDADHTGGKERILRAQGLAFFNEQGQAYKISGTVQDVTDQRRVQTALEQQVQERTEALEATNVELAATNEELAITNEELADSIRDLQRSNENLQQFAYIASHDLQEPLRKIQSFGDLLKAQYGRQLGDGADYLQRMQSAAHRMSTLIKDLLTFSRISTRQETAASVALDRVIQSVLTDLDLTIQETGAVVGVDPLPTVTGDPSQLGQLFQNLLSNALKFRRADVTPSIQITAQTVAVGSLPPSVKPSRLTTAYHCIAVRDNGIGFDQKYTDRIFQVFQRLHNKNQYAGTGIGLAICEKVAANHGGAISATSQVGKGATFSVYLPI